MPLENKKLLRSVIDECNKYLDKKIEVSSLHNYIAYAEQQFTSYGEFKIKNKLMLLESEIDYVRVMNNEIDFMYSQIHENDCYPQMEKIIKKYVGELSSYLK